ncbi:hypothetical protein V6N12_050995 [Hibiscus sabdariffa]|uniref:Uncharacterized protein n=1 Tax=Hibiscus sabdariffa TaxID=183260 RepID=A0ABR2GE04_9ROSI
MEIDLVYMGFKVTNFGVWKSLVLCVNGFYRLVQQGTTGEASNDWVKEEGSLRRTMPNGGQVELRFWLEQQGGLDGVDDDNHRPMVVKISDEKGFEMLENSLELFPLFLVPFFPRVVGEASFYF